MAGVLLVAIVIVVIVLVICCCMRGSQSKYELSKASRLEMGTRTPSKPVLGGKLVQDKVSV